MAANGSAIREAAHRVISEARSEMVKARLRIPETRPIQAEIGACLDYARRVQGWTLEQFADELDRDARQVARWIRGEERTQLDVVFACEVLRQPFVVALAVLANCEVETTVRMRRRA